MQAQEQALVYWLRSVGMPEHLWPRLIQKLRGDVFDVGTSFALAQRALPSTNEEEEGEGEQDGQTTGSPGTAEVAEGLATDTSPSHMAGDATPTAHAGGVIEEEEEEEESGAGAGGAGHPSRAGTHQRIGAGGELAGGDAALLPGIPLRDDGLDELQRQHHQQQQYGEADGQAEEDEEVRLAPGYALLSTRDIGACEDVWLVDHCFTFPLHEDMWPVLEGNPELRARLEAILRLPPYAESAAAAAVSAEENEEARGVPATAWEQPMPPFASLAGAPATEQHLLAGSPGAKATAALRVQESMWPHIGLYHLRQHTTVAPGSAGPRDTAALFEGGAGGVGGEASRTRTHYSYQQQNDDADLGDEGPHGEEEVTTMCCGFFHDEVGSAISLTTKDAAANVKLLSIPIYFPDKGCVLSVMWNTQDMAAGTEAKRRPAHRWEGASGFEVSDVLFGRGGATHEDSLRMCVACWRNKLALRQSNRATVFSLMAPRDEQRSGEDGGGGADTGAVWEKVALAAQALLDANGPVTVYSDNQGVYRLASRFPPLSRLLQRASVPREARLLWRLHRTPFSMRELDPNTRYIFWLPGEHRFLDHGQLVWLLHTKVGSMPWCPVVYDGVHQLKEFIGDYVVRQLAINWELGSLARAAEAAGAPPQAAANIHYDIFAEQKRLLRQQDGTNLWLVRRMRNRSSGRPALPVDSGMTSPSSRDAFGGEEEDVGSAEGVSWVLFGRGGAQRRRGGGGAGEEAHGGAEDGNSSSGLPPSPSSVDGHADAPGSAWSTTDGALEHVVMVTENLEAVLKVAEAYPTLICKVAASPFLAVRGLYARAQTVASGSAASSEPETPFYFARYGDSAPVFQFVVSVTYSPAGIAATAPPESDITPRPASELAVHVHHVVPVRWVDYTPHGATEHHFPQGGGGPANVCLCGPLAVCALDAAPSRTKMPSGPASALSSPSTGPAATAAVAAALQHLPAYVRGWLDSREETRALRLINEEEEGEGRNQDGYGMLHRCKTLLRELFRVIGQDYGKTVSPALRAATTRRADATDGAGQRTAYYGVYGVDVSLAFSHLKGPTQPGEGPLTEVQPVLLGLTRDPELAGVAAVHPGVYGDLLSTLLLDCPINATRVL